MVKPKRSSKQQANKIVIGIVVAVVALGLLYLTVGAVMHGGGPLWSKAARNTNLTSGDDVFSLQQDLEILGRDATVDEESNLNQQE